MEDLTRIGALLPGIIGGLLTAIVCGGLIGLERGMRRKAAGLRDYILVCFGAALYMMSGELLGISRGEGGTPDPSRIAAQIATAIGFLGAGVIIHRRGEVGGITTAAAIWVTAAIGIVIGAGYPLLALMVTGVVLMALTLLYGVEERLSRAHRKSLLLKIVLREDTGEVRERIQTALQRQGVQIDAVRAERVPNGTKLTITAMTGEDPRALLELLWVTPGVVEVEH
ncbi:MAG: MgtC/SapB family protein [Calditrichaeota bacterium]|nr:MgtC/SapB family protein [Calditrichota bacterium]